MMCVLETSCTSQSYIKKQEIISLMTLIFKNRFSWLDFLKLFGFMCYFVSFVPV